MSKLSRSRICFGTYYSYLRESVRYVRGIDTVKEAQTKIVSFSDGEISVKFEESLRNMNLFVFGETTRNLTELLLIIDAAKRSSVKEITVVLPYYGYSRQDKREGSRGCLGASMIAQVLQGLGINRVITIDLHAEQIQGFFHAIPVEHIRGKNIFIESSDLFFDTLAYNFNVMRSNLVIATPDAGGTIRASSFAHELELGLVTIHKRRSGPGVVESMELYGNVDGLDVMLIDDIADSCGTLAKAASLLKSNGARRVIALATHPVLSKGSLTNIPESELDGILLSDTLKFGQGFGKPSKTFNCMKILDSAISLIAEGESISHLTSN